MSLQTRMVMIAFLAGVALVAVIEVLGGRPGAEYIPPIDTSQNGNVTGYSAGYWIGYWAGHWVVFGVIPLVFAVIAIAATAYKAGLSSSVINALGAVASVVGISLAVSCAQFGIAAIYPMKELPFAEAGSSRESFVKGALSGCAKTVQANPANKTISAASMDAYCSCYANSMADVVTREEVASAEQHKVSASMAEKAKAASQKCRPLAQGRQ